MSEPATICALEVENVKRVKAVRMKPARAGLTVIGGRNAQGKTSVLDAICWALGGKRYEPDCPHRDGSASDPSMRVELSNGIVAERRGKSGALKVTDPSGARAGQALLDEFVEQLALDLPKFMAASDRDKAKELLRIIGVEDRLEELDRLESSLEQRRLERGQLARARRGAAETMPWYPDAPDSQVDIADLADQQREALERNAANNLDRADLAVLRHDLGEARREVADAEVRLVDMRRELKELEDRYEARRARVEALVDVDVSEMSELIASAEETNAKVRANEARGAAIAEAEALEAEYADLDAQVRDVRARRAELLEGADMPLPGLSVDGGALVYRGHTWGDMSGSEQLMVAAAVVRRLKPSCGFVLVDKLEQMDSQTLAEFGAWCESEGLQVIGTRVSTGPECSVVIEDGVALEPDAPSGASPEADDPQDADAGFMPAF